MSPLDSALSTPNNDDISEAGKPLPAPPERLESAISSNQRRIGLGQVELSLDQAETTSATLRVPLDFDLSAPKKRIPEPRVRFVPIKTWNCHVTDIDAPSETFTARIQESGDQSDDDEEMVFDFDEINDDEIHLLKEGAVFLWFIGKMNLPSGQKIRGHQIVFRRMPVYLEADKQKALEEAKVLAEGLRWEDTARSA